jgi:hypothetical protein
MNLSHDPLELEFPYLILKTPVQYEKSKASFNIAKKLGFGLRKEKSVAKWFGIPGSGTVTNEQRDKQTMLAQNFTNIVSNATIESFNNNSQTYQSMLIAENTILIQDLRCDGNILIQDIEQTNVITEDQQITMINKNNVEVRKSMKSKITNAILDGKTTSGSSLQGILDGFGKSVGSVTRDISDVLRSGARNEKNIRERDIKNIIDAKVNDVLVAIFNNDNVQSAITEARAKNVKVIQDNRCTGNFTMRRVAQQNTIESLINVLFDNDNTVSLHQKALVEIGSELRTLIENDGDFTAIGGAIAENIDAIGGATKDVGSAVSDMLDGAGGLGGDLLDGLMIPIIAGVVGLVLIMLINK